MITGDRPPEVAHIYPFFSLSTREEDKYGVRHVFWDLLRTFWPQEKVTAWQTELFPNGITETGKEQMQNLITLSPNTHRKWNYGSFALKPISLSEDKKVLTLQFYWQKQMEFTSDMSLSTTPFSTEGLDRNEDQRCGETQMFNYKTQRLMKSGDLIEMHTTDAIERPLPSFQLLELQWFLQRIIGMAGSAEPLPIYQSDTDEEEEEEEMSNPGLGEVDEESFQFAAEDTLPESPEFLRKDNLLPFDGPKSPRTTTDHGGLESGSGSGIV